MIKSRRMRWAGHVAQMAKKKKKNAYRILVGKTEGKRRRWVDNSKIDLKKIEWDGLE
jgi:hypothetical protein